MKYILLLFLSFIASSSAQSQKKTLRTVIDEKEPKIIDTVFCLNTADSAKISIPLTIISGKEKGPTLTIASGIRGTECSSILSLLHLRREINPEKLRGNLIIIPLMSLNGYFDLPLPANLSNAPALDLAFPGNPMGTAEEAIADFITTKIFDSTDVFLDLREGNPNEDLIPYACYYENNEFTDQTRLASRLCEISGLGTVIGRPYIQSPGQPARHAFKQAVRLGIPALSITIGKLASCEKSSLLVSKRAIYQMMAELKMYENRQAPHYLIKNRCKGQANIYGPGRGFFYSSFIAGAKVAKDEEIGYITDIFGGNVKIIAAPVSGIILKKRSSLTVNKGEALFCIGYGKTD